MAQATQITIDNQTFPSFRSKLNESLSALNTLNSGTSRPSSASAGTIWLDTTNSTNPTLKFFDGTDDISLATIDYTANTVNWLDSSVSLTSPVAISGSASAGAEIRLPEDTDNGSNYVGLKAADSISSNITFTLPNADGSDGQVIKTDGSGNLSFGSAGRTGTVDWNTTAITADPNPAVSGTGYFVNTTSGSITITLPTSPSAGDIVAFADYALTWDTNNCILDPGSNKINGETTDYTISSEGKSLTLVYIDGTQGWKVVNDGNADTGSQAAFTTATGGTILTCGDYKIHVFTGPGTFCVSTAGNPAGGGNSVDYMVVAGGGGGAGPSHGGAGGAGGFRESGGTASGCYTVSPLGTGVSALSITATGYPITVGAGGSGVGIPTAANPGSSGSNSVFSTITSTGGGLGGGGGNTTACTGGSGGGAGGPATTGASGNTPPVSPPQGNPGGNAGHSAPNYGTGGGGGATSAGTNGTSTTAGNGGNGAGTAITTSTCYGTPGPSGSIRYYAGGGGGSSFFSGTPSPQGTGGYGGGGNGRAGPGTYTSYPGTVNTGGGAGGASRGDAGPGTNTCIAAGNGGSGIVIIRYKYQ